MSINRGSIHWCYLPTYSLKITSKTRPCIVISNTIQNKGANTVNVIPLTTKQKRMDLPVHVEIGDSVALVENILTIEKDDVGDFIRHLTRNEQREIDIAVLTQYGVIK